MDRELQDELKAVYGLIRQLAEAGEEEDPEKRREKIEAVKQKAANYRPGSYFRVLEGIS